MCTEEEYKERFLKMEKRINTLWDSKEAVHPIDLRFAIVQKDIKQLHAANQELDTNFKEVVRDTGSCYGRMLSLLEEMTKAEKAVKQAHREVRWYFFGSMVMWVSMFGFFLYRGAY